MRLSRGFRPDEQNRIAPFQCVADALGQIVAAANAAVIDPNFGAGSFKFAFQMPHQRFIFPSMADKNFRFVNLQCYESLQRKDPRITSDDVQQLERGTAGKAEALLPTFDG